MEATQPAPRGNTLVPSPTTDLGSGLGVEVRQSALLLGLVLGVAGVVTAICSALQLLA